MKLITYELKKGKVRESRTGIFFDGDFILDLQTAAALYLREEEKEKRPYDLAAELIGGELVKILKKGRATMILAQKAYKNFLKRQRAEKKHLLGLQGEQITFARQEINLKAPILQPSKIIAMGLNFRDHAEENKMPIPEIPVGFLKASSSVTGPYDHVPYPPSISQLDYEIELCLVIGKKGKNIPREKAYEYVAGYMIMNDLSARDVQVKEMEKRLLLLGKSFDGFAPIGPYLVSCN